MNRTLWRPKPPTPNWPHAILSIINPKYRSRLLSNMIQLLHDKPVLYKPIFKDVTYIGLIITPVSLPCAIFSHFHAGPTGGHMGRCKNLFRICMSFLA